MEQLTLTTEAERRRAVAYVVALTANTPMAPERYERHLMKRYERGEITIDQMLELLDASTYRVLYSSWAVKPWSEEQLQMLLNKSRAYNTAHDITGMLLYSDGRFVQVLEGPESAVRTLYARIQQDPRHTRVLTVCERPGSRRYFTDWSMDFGYVAKQEVEQTLEVLHGQSARGLISEDPNLQALLQVFGIGEEEKVH